MKTRRRCAPPFFCYPRKTWGGGGVQTPPPPAGRGLKVNQYDALIGDGRAGVEAPSCERGVHVRTCRCTPHLTCVSVLSNGSLAAHQVQTQSAQQFARYGKRVCTCARADATHPDLCKARIYWAPSHTQNLNAILPAVCEIWKRGVHVRTCWCTPPQTCVKHLSNGSLATHQIWTQSAQPFARSGKRVCTCARADALHLRHVASTYLMGL